jgi:Trypsin-like peptidase domain
MKVPRLPKILALGSFLLLLWPPFHAAGSSLTDAEQLLAEGAGFTWEDARSRSVKIIVQRRDGSAENAVRSSIGSGFLISPDGLFVTAYHVMKYCLGNNQAAAGFSVALDCSTEHPKIEYRAQNDGKEFEIEIVSYLRLKDSVKGEVQTPEETMRLKDFVIGRLKAPASTRFAFWQLNEFKRQPSGDIGPRAFAELKPLVPPKKVFVAGYAAGPDFALAQGFLNLTEDQHRAYFAWNRDIYNDPRLLQKYGIPAGTRWGIPVANYMSGGAVIDAAGDVLGLVVNQSAGNAGVLSTQNFLETFFSRTAQPGTPPAVVLKYSRTPLYLKAGNNL